MLHKLLFNGMITLLILEISMNLKAEAKQKYSLIKTFCIASLKSKLNIKDKQKKKEISHFTCDCFLEKYKSGSSMKSSRFYCKNKAAEKYNL